MRHAQVRDLVLPPIINSVTLSGYLISLSLHKMVTIMSVSSRTVDKDGTAPLVSDSRWDLTDFTGDPGIRHPESGVRWMKLTASRAGDVRGVVTQSVTHEHISQGSWPHLHVHLYTYIKH